MIMDGEEAEEGPRRQEFTAKTDDPRSQEIEAEEVEKQNKKKEKAV